MRDLLRDFPELDSLEAGARQKLIVDTQKRIVRQPAILLGLIAAMSVPALLALWSFPPHGLMGTLVTGGLVGLSGYGYLAVIVKPRMREAFRKMGNTPRT